MRLWLWFVSLFLPSWHWKEVDLTEIVPPSSKTMPAYIHSQEQAITYELDREGKANGNCGTDDH